MVPQLYHLGCVARVYCGAVRVTHDAGAAGHLSAVHRPQCATEQSATEAWLVCGRRAGKIFILALCAVFVACFFDYRNFLAPGERATVLIIATNRSRRASFSDTCARC